MRAGVGQSPPKGATAEPVQRLDLDRERLGVAGVEAMQPLRELVAVQRMAHGPFHLRELLEAIGFYRLMPRSLARYCCRCSAISSRTCSRVFGFFIICSSTASRWAFGVAL